MKPHPYSEIFPPMEGVDFDALVEDIKTRGLVQPIVLYEGKILDGRNRARACNKLGI
jgi:ParB-like chromosome segregation protein Spo0J